MALPSSASMSQDKPNSESWTYIKPGLELARYKSVYIQPGDVLIKGGSPGHAVIVVDVAVNSGGERVFMLAQSYMPAQDIHILRNPAANGTHPWFKVTSNPLINTPEWTFEQSQLRTW